MRPSLPFMLGALALLLGLIRPSDILAQDFEERGAYVREHFVKSEHTIPMRDGVNLYARVFQPRDTSQVYPIMLSRTPYSCAPYGEDGIPPFIGPSSYMEEEGYIFVCQDVRGRWMSEGSYDNMRPHVPGDADIDESSDTWDTIEWLLANVPRNNGKVGMWGISYPGFYAAAALPEAHPALAASSPQAPISDFFFDDFHHRGAYTLAYWFITPLFGLQSGGPTTQAWYRFQRPTTRDGYKFYMDLGPLSNTSARYPEQFGEDNFFWRDLSEHPNYDEFWQRRNILPHLTGIDQAVLTVGGWFDAEDLYGPLNIYRTVESENPGTFNAIVMGPWRHGGWFMDESPHLHGDIYFGDHISDWYQKEIEAPFFRYFLKGEGEVPDFDAMMFDTGRGTREWRKFATWPPAEAETIRWYLRDGEQLTVESPVEGEAEATRFISDPQKPVPVTDKIRFVFTPARYMSEDQRFAGRRPDVLVFQTGELAADLTLAGDILARLMVSTTGEDADWVVKLIDVYPDSLQNEEHTPEGVQLGGYQQMVRSEIVRGRFRNSFERPEPFTPGEVTEVRLPLQDVLHTFPAGHRIMIQVQSTWFPLFDRNPQGWVDNIFEAVEGDFRTAEHTVWHAPGAQSWIEVKMLPAATE